MTALPAPLCHARKKHAGRVYACRLAPGHDGPHRGGEGCDQLSWVSKGAA